MLYLKSVTGLRKLGGRWLSGRLQVTVVEGVFMWRGAWVGGQGESERW